MVARGTSLPRKLKHDSIVEALLELRFETITISEVLFGRLIEHHYWKGFAQRRMPAYDIPDQIRQIDPNLRYIPIIELTAPDNKSVLRLGKSVLSYHRKAPYAGWTSFKIELEHLVESLFSTTEQLSVMRLGLRYLNALRPDPHHINSIEDLDLSLQISGQVLSSKVNINFTTTISDSSSCTVRIATRELVLGAIPPDTSVYIDGDVFTNEGFSTTEQAVVRSWLEVAHTQGKVEFFHLLKQNTIDELEVKER